MMNNKKAAISTITKLVIALIIISLIAFFVPNLFAQSVNIVQVEQCKKTYDYDNDNLKWEDECYCDYGGLKDYNFFQMQNAPNCVLTPKDPKSVEGKYILYKGLSSDLATCKKKFDALYKSLPLDTQKICLDQKSDLLTGDGITKDCMNAVCQKKGANSNECLQRCLTPDKQCDADLVKACKENTGNIA
jgi:hypothetical protein